MAKPDIEIRKTLWTAFIVLNGGLGGLIVNLSPFNFKIEFIIKIVILFLGLFFYYFLLTSIADVSNSLKKLFNKLEQGD